MRKFLITLMVLISRLCLGQLADEDVTYIPFKICQYTRQSTYWYSRNKCATVYTKRTGQ
jgi:hypothetical protein